MKRVCREGLFLSLEGTEAAGKTTQVTWLARWLQERGIPYTLAKDPGGTALGEKVRALLLSERAAGYTWETEVLLYAASRAQLVAEVIRPALERREVVICDRYVDASLAYQAYGSGREPAPILATHAWGAGGLLPHRTYLLHLPLAVARERLQARDTAWDHMERRPEVFHERVIAGYQSLARQHAERFVVLDATLGPEVVAAQLCQDLQGCLEKTYGSR